MVCSKIKVYHCRGFEKSPHMEELLNQIIDKARIMLSLNGDYLHGQILGDTTKKSPNDILSDEEYCILTYFTAVGTARVYHYYQEYGYEEVKKHLDSFDDILRKLGKVDGRIVYRMDTYEDYLEKDEYLQKYLKYIQDGICLKIPWALSVSMTNWNLDAPQHPIWEIELLPDNSKAHPVFPFLTEDETLQETETEVRFESNVLLEVVDVLEKDGFPYIKMKEIPCAQHHNIKQL